MSKSQLKSNIKRLKSLEQSNKVLATGIVDGTLVTIYGEIHNNIDNTFYESLDLTDQTVFVEHSTKLCELKPHEHSLFKNAKGSEFIWYTRVVNKQPVTCIDTRLEDGFLSAMQETALYEVDIHDMVKVVTRLIKVALALKDKFSSIIDVYTGIVDTIKRQSVILLLLDNLLKNSDSKPEIVIDGKTMKPEDILSFTKNFLIMNIIKLASLSVDMNIINMIHRHNEESINSPISIFVGINHAIRLSIYLNLKVITHEDIFEPFMNGASVWARGNKESEESILTQLKYNHPRK
jgi:hypothetical protein